MSPQSQIVLDSIAINLELSSYALESVQFHSQSLYPVYKCVLKNNQTKIILALKVVDQSKMAQAETLGLKAIAATGANAPKVYKSSNTKSILMDFVPTGIASAGAILENLQKLYENTSAEYGWSQDNFIGRLVQRNALTLSFEEFWMTWRVSSHLKKIADDGWIQASEIQGIEKKIRQFMATHDLNAMPARLIHGDLWSGNVLFDGQGRSYFIDPSVSYANPEQDLAMLCLFGSPVSIAQMESLIISLGHPPGFAHRIAFWQIYPLLIHIRLFGSSYVNQFYHALARI